jgi:hypothetical protein
MSTAPRLNDEDWNHLEQTLKMLSLAIAQIETALHEGDLESANIASTFIEINSQAKQLSRNEIDAQSACKNIENQTMNAVIAFQFYDRLSQRVDHVQNGLRKMVDIIGDHKAISDPEKWKRSQDDIKASYTMEAERLMFDRIMQGEELEEVLKIYRHNFAASHEGEEQDSGDIIELF